MISVCKYLNVLIILLSLSATPALAQEHDSSKDMPGDEENVTEEVVVTTTRSEVNPFDAPQAVTVITREEIMASPFERVEDIVRSKAGVHNFRHYGLQRNGIVSPLSMRGVGKNRVLILVDGVPQNDNFNNSISWVAWGHIPKEAIERIEIVRGPTSAVHGSDGLGGVINIITRKPGDERKTSVRGEGGTAETYAGHGFHSQKVGHFGFMAAGGYEKSDGFYMVEDPEDYEIRRHREVGKALGKVTYELSPSSYISLAGLYYDHETGKGREYFYDDLTLGQYWMNFRHRGEAFDFRGLVYYNGAKKHAYQDTAKDNYSSLFRTEHMPATVWGADFQGAVPMGLSSKFIFGVAYKEADWEYDNEYEDSSRDEGAQGQQRFASPFINLEGRFLGDSLIVNAGARYDWIETSDGANWDSEASAGKPAYYNEYDTETSTSFSPTAGITWHPDEKTALRASGGKGFRAPSLFELYKVHVRQGGVYYREANPELDPEEIWSYDIGVERFLISNFWFRTTFYQSFGKDYIGDRLTETAPFAGGTKTRYEYVLDNIAEVDIYGVENELWWYPSNELSVFANYTYNMSIVGKDENNEDLEGNYLPNDPRHQAHAGIIYSNPSIVNVSLIGNYYADIYFDNENELKEDDYFTMDASVSRDFNGLTVYVNAENIFNEEYAIFLQQGRSDTIAPGAIVTGGVKAEF